MAFQKFAKPMRFWKNHFGFENWKWHFKTSWSLWVFTGIPGEVKIFRVVFLQQKKW